MSEHTRRGLVGLVLAGGTVYSFLGGDSAGFAPVPSDDDDGIDLEVETLEASDVDWESATLSGELTEIDGASSTDVMFELWDSDQSDDIIETSSERLSDPGEFHRAVNGLSAETTYEAIAVAQTNGTIEEGEIIEFSTETEPSIEVVTTDTVDEIGTDQARLYGEVVDMVNTSEAEAFFEFRPTTDESRSDTDKITVTEPQTYDILLDGLESGTEYEGRARAVATDRDDVEDYGEFVNWTTESEIPDSAIAHYDAQALSGYSDGDSVSSWDDELGNNNLTGSGPTFANNGINGYPSVDFDDDYFENTSINESQPVTIFAVFRYDGGDYIWSGGDDHFSLMAHGYGYWRMNAGSQLDGNDPTTGVHLFTTVYNGDNSIQRQNGLETASGNVGSKGLTGFTLGARYSIENHLQGAVGELVICQDSLSINEIEGEEQRLADKWGISI